MPAKLYRKKIIYSGLQDKNYLANSPAQKKRNCTDSRNGESPQNATGTLLTLLLE